MKFSVTRFLFSFNLHDVSLMMSIKLFCVVHQFGHCVLKAKQEEFPFVKINK